MNESTTLVRMVCDVAEQQGSSVLAVYIASKTPWCREHAIVLLDDGERQAQRYRCTRYFEHSGDGFDSGDYTSDYGAAYTRWNGAVLRAEQDYANAAQA